jgi:hypothetical protein
MRNYPTDFDLISRAMGAACHLARLGVNRRRLGEEGVCELVAMAMRSHPTDRDMTWLALAAGIRMAQANEDNQRRLVEAGVRELVGTATRNHPTDHRLLSEGLRLLNIVASIVETRRRPLPPYAAAQKPPKTPGTKRRRG